MIKTTVKVHFVRALCLGCVNLFSGLTLWPLSSTTWWDLAAGCVWVEVCIFAQRPLSPLNTTPPWLSPPPSTYMCLLVYVHTCVQAYLCVTVVNPLSHKLINAVSHPFDWMHTCMRVHTCVHKCACLLCRSGDQMSGHRSYIRLSVTLWFCSLVEFSDISAEDFHLIMHPKQISGERRSDL